MIVSHHHRFIFLKTRKTAGTSIEIALTKHLKAGDVLSTPYDEEDQDRFDVPPGMNRDVPSSEWRWRDYARAAVGLRPRFSEHSPAWFIRRSLPAIQWDGYLKWAVIRNPWDSAVSAYFWNAREETDLSFADWLATDRVVGYVNWPMITIDGELVLDTVVRYEDLTRGLRRVTETLSLPELTLPRSKGGFRPPEPYQEWYNEATKERVLELFADEIDYFGWTF